MNVDYHMVVIDSNTGRDHPFWMLTATWALLSRNQDLLNSPAIRQAARPPNPNVKQVRLWTDDFTSLYQILYPWGIMPAAGPPGAASPK